MSLTWFVRERGKPLEQLSSFRHAEIVAREKSQTNESGLIETVVQLQDGRQLVDAIFIRGRKLQQGKRARDSSRLNLTPFA